MLQRPVERFQAAIGGAAQRDKNRPKEDAVKEIQKKEHAGSSILPPQQGIYLNVCTGISFGRDPWQLITIQ